MKKHSAKNVWVPCLVFLGGYTAISHHEINMEKLHSLRIRLYVLRKGLTLQS